MEKHFEGKKLAKGLFGYLVGQIEKKIGKVEIISIPCCVHLFGNYDFLAALPKKDGLEIRIALGRKLKSKRLISSVPLSKKTFKNCFFVKSKAEIDKEFIGWLKDSYYLRD